MKTIISEEERLAQIAKLEIQYQKSNCEDAQASIRGLILDLERLQDPKVAIKAMFASKSLPDLNTFLSRKIVAPEPIITGLINERGSMLMFAPSGGGKSMVAMALALFASSKAEFCGAWDNSFGMHKTLYLDAEIDEFEGQRRLGKLKTAMKIDDSNFTYLNLIAEGMTELHLLDPDYQEIVLDYIRTEGVKLIIIDNIRSIAYSDDENSSASVNSFNRFIDRVHGAGASAIVIHHTNKEKSKDGWSNYAGSTNFERPYSVIMALKTEHVWTKDEPQQQMAFQIRKQRSSNITLREGLLTVCDNNGLIVEGPNREAYVMAPDHVLAYQVLNEGHDAFQTNKTWKHGEKTEAWEAISKWFADYPTNSNPKNLDRAIKFLTGEMNKAEATSAFEPTIKGAGTMPAEDDLF